MSTLSHRWIFLFCYLWLIIVWGKALNLISIASSVRSKRGAYRSGPMDLLPWLYLFLVWHPCCLAHSFQGQHEHNEYCELQATGLHSGNQPSYQLPEVGNYNTFCMYSHHWEGLNMQYTIWNNALLQKEQGLKARSFSVVYINLQ